MPRHLSPDELAAGLPAIEASPPDNGVLEAIVIRPETGARRDLPSCQISLRGGVHGDRWALAGTAPDPDMQICIMNARAIALIARERTAWPAAGDNLFIDLDLSPENLPTGQRLAIGTAIIEVTAMPHAGCDKFIARFGRDACIFVNTGAGKALRLRGIYARVVQDGLLTVGDRVRKLGTTDAAAPHAADRASA
jgi:MOSC domain-containing protein YiiM